MPSRDEQEVDIALNGLHLTGDLSLPARAQGLVVFVHGSGSSRRSVRNRQVASALQRRGLATLLFDLLTEDEDQDYETRFDIPLLTRRLLDVTRWAQAEQSLRRFPLGYFGASTGAAAALTGAAQLGTGVAAVVSRGGRPDLAFEHLDRVQAPTLLIVGGRDDGVLEFNEQAYARLRCVREISVVAGATHLFEEPGALEEVAKLAGDWLVRYCTARPVLT